MPQEEFLVICEYRKKCNTDSLLTFDSCWYFCLAHGSFPTMTSNQSDRSNDSGTGASADQTNTSRTNGDRGQAQGSTQEESESVAQTSVAVPVGTLRVSNSSVMGQEYHEYYNYGQNDKKPNGTQ